MNRTDGELNRAVIAHRERPSDESSRRLMAAQRAHVAHFQREQTGEYIERTRERRITR